MICSTCGLPMSILEDADCPATWYCDGPNDNTKRRGCFGTEPAFFIISDEGAWNNEQGWTDISNGTYFTEAETKSLNLPVGDNVKWVRCP
jgi:hypothetical protein